MPRLTRVNLESWGHTFKYYGSEMEHLFLKYER